MTGEAVVHSRQPVTNDGSGDGEPFQQVLLDVWREVCRHTDINQSTQTIAGLLTRHAPIGQIFVRSIDRQRGCLETVAVGIPAPDYLLPEARTECTEAVLEELLAWCRRGGVTHGTGGAADKGLVRFMVPGDAEAEVLAGPLGRDENPFGVLVVIAGAGHRFDDGHAAMMETLLEPFSTALENDRRLHEMAAMRAAAEAEKHSLLTRLGRKDLGEDVVGADSGLRTVIERVELVARSDAPALILGETGTGKELIARMIHTRSARSAGPFMRVNCGAIPAELIDSQLFGHERGAFTGAVEARQGWFERADGGTLLLDEVGELPLAAQVRLLRILQDGWLERVGGQESTHVNVRIVAATHRDLAAMVAEGSFREDLWYRIAVFPIWLPPLRERREDIAELARHFAKRAAARFLLPLALPSPDDIQRLTAYGWPGNIRELAAVIDRAAILGDGKRLEVAQSLGTTVGPAAAPPDNARADLRRPGSEILSLDAAMKQHIESVLAITHGRIEGRRGAAALLKINPHTLRARMRKLGIDWARFRAEEDV
ncbi:MAG: sigma-54 dependent transcriptional regulator [Thermoguttaceae bacterium]